MELNLGSDDTAWLATLWTQVLTSVPAYVRASADRKLACLCDEMRRTYASAEDRELCLAQLSRFTLAIATELKVAFASPGRPRTLAGQAYDFANSLSSALQGWQLAIGAQREVLRQRVEQLWVSAVDALGVFAEYARWDGLDAWIAVLSRGKIEAPTGSGDAEPSEESCKDVVGVGTQQDTRRSSDLAAKPAAQKAAKSKHAILFLAANPHGTNRLELDKEVRAIQAELERSGQHDRFELVVRWAVEPFDLLREIGRLKPTVLHFSGHGQPTAGASPSADGAVHRDIADDWEHAQGGLYFHGPGGRAQVVSTAAFAQAVATAGASVRLVVLNACYSGVQAQALLEHVDFVVGMAGTVSDEAARRFAAGFYCGLGLSESVAGAYRYGCTAIVVEGLPDADRPQLAVRKGADATGVVLAADPLVQFTASLRSGDGVTR